MPERATREEVRLVFGRGDPGQRPDLGVGDFAVAHGGGDQGKLFESPRDPHLLSRGPHGESGAPVEPVGAAPEPAAPAEALVELTNQNQELILGSGQERREAGDPLTQGLDLGLVTKLGRDRRRVS